MNYYKNTYRKYINYKNTHFRPMFTLKNILFLAQGTINLKASTEGYKTPCIYIKYISALNNLPQGKVLKKDF